jgi:hypothetical protein
VRDVVRDILPIYSDILPDLGHQTRSSSDEVEALAATTHLPPPTHSAQRPCSKARPRMYVAEYTQNRVGEAEKEGMELGSHRGQVEAAPIPTVQRVCPNCAPNDAE